MNKFDRYIIENMEEIYLKDKVNILYNKDKEFDNLLLMYLIYFFAIIIPTCMMDSDFGWESFLINVGISIPVLILITLSLRVKRIILLHKIMFWNYKDREIEVNAFVENNRVHVHQPQTSEVQKSAYKYNNLDEEMDKYIDNIDGFCDKYLSHHKSLKKFIKERLQ